MATDDAQIFNRFDQPATGEYESKSGVALSIYIQNFDLVSGEKFGISTNAGFYGGTETLSESAQGDLGHNVSSNSERLAIAYGVDFGSGNGRGDEVNGGRVDARISWRQDSSRQTGSRDGLNKRAAGIG